MSESAAASGPTGGATLLAGRGLSFSFRDRPRAVDGVGLAVAGGELVVVVGPNGAGKSTLLKLLGGLLEPEAGEVELDGEALRGIPLRARARRVAFVPQALRALPDAQVAGFVLGGRYPHLGTWRQAGASDHRAVAAALESCDLVEFEERQLTELSGGELQRVLLARALAQEADVLLVDEPTSSLDPEHQVRVFALLRALVRAGRAAVVVTHDLALAGQFATRLLLLAAGRVVEEGPPQRVLRRECLEPVYGQHLLYGTGPGDPGRPFVLPWWSDGEGE